MKIPKITIGPKQILAFNAL